MLFASSPSFEFTIDRKIKNFKVEDVKYTIYEINEDSSGDLIVEKGSIKKSGLFKNKTPKIKFDFSKANYKIKFLYKDKNVRYGATLNLKQEWFLDNDYKNGNSKIYNNKNQLGPQFSLLNDRYPYSFKISLEKMYTNIKGRIFSDSNGFKDWIDDARVFLNSDTKNQIQDGSDEETTTDMNGYFNLRILLDQDSISFSPGVIIIKNGYHITEQTYSQREINQESSTLEQQILIKGEKEEIGQICNSKQLTYNYDCNECICKEGDKKWYPNEQVCDIFESSCEDGETLVFKNKEGGYEIKQGEMKGYCIDNISMSEKLNISNKSYVPLISLRFIKNGEPIRGAILAYEDYFNNGTSIIGETDENGVLVVSNDKYNYQLEGVENVTSALNGYTSLGIKNLKYDDSNYFYLEPTKVTSNINKHYFTLTDKDGEQIDFYFKNNGKNINDKKINLIRYPITDVEIDIKNNIKIQFNEYKLAKFKLDEIESVKNVQNEQVYNNDRCEFLIEQIDNYMNDCNWYFAEEFVDEFMNDCAIYEDTRFLTQLINFYYSKVNEMDEDDFLSEQKKDSKTIPTFSILDAMYKLYDEITMMGNNKLSNYDLSYYFYRRFQFYYKYSEYIIKMQEFIDEGLSTNRWEYKYGYNELNSKNFRKLGKSDFKKNIYTESEKAMRGFEEIKDNAIGEEIPDFRKADLMKRTRLVLENQLKGL